VADGDSPMGFFPGELLEQRAHEHPDRTALIAREEVVTFSLLNQRAHGLAAHLQREGIRAGDRVGVLLPNSAAIPLTYFATQRVGAVPVMLDVRLKGQELRSVLHDAKLALLVTRGSLATDVEAALEGSRLVPMWLVDGEGEGSFERRLAAAGTPLAAARCEAEDDAVILYTSGTTGDPKGVVLSYGNLAQYPRVMTEYGITGASTVRGCILPMSHIVGPLVCNDLVDKGFTLVIFDQINPVTLLEGIQKHRVSVFESVPIVFLLLLGVRNLASYDTSSLTVAAMMGTSIPVPLLRAFQSALPHVKVIQGYGLTETSPMVTLVELDRAVAKMGSIGRAVPGIEVRIVNEAGEDVPRGEPGRTGGDHHARTARHEGLFRQAGGDGRLHPGRLVLHRRRRPVRRGRLLLPSGAARRHDHHRGSQRLPCRGGERDLHLSRRAGDRGLRRPRCQARARPRRRGGAASRACRRSRRAAGFSPGQSRGLPGSTENRDPRLTAPHVFRKGHPRRGGRPGRAGLARRAVTSMAKGGGIDPRARCLRH